MGGAFYPADGQAGALRPQLVVLADEPRAIELADDQRERGGRRGVLIASHHLGQHGEPMGGKPTVLPLLVARQNRVHNGAALGSCGVALGARLLQRGPGVQVEHARHKGQTSQLPPLVVVAAERRGVHRHDAAGAPREQHVEHLSHIAAHRLTHEHRRTDAFCLHDLPQPTGQVGQREIQRERPRLAMGRRVPR